MPGTAEIVPADILAPPDGRGLDAHEAALVLDGHLRRLAGQEARCRAVLGRLARRFLARQGQHELGFARLGDYARERLGLSAREVQSLAAVSARLEALPAIRAAFAEGEVSWAQVRLLARVADADTEAEWLARARGRTVRALATVIRVGGAPAREDDDEGDEPHVRFRLRCPRRMMRLWRRVVDLGRRKAGSELTQGQAAEAIAAEGLSAQPACGEAWPDAPLPTAGPPDPDETRAAFAELEWAAVAEAISEDVERLAAGVEGLDPFALDQRMRAAVTALQRVD